MNQNEIDQRQIVAFDFAVPALVQSNDTQKRQFSNYRLGQRRSLGQKEPARLNRVRRWVVLWQPVSRTRHQFEQLRRRIKEIKNLGQEEQ